MRVGQQAQVKQALSDNHSESERQKLKLKLKPGKLTSKRRFSPYVYVSRAGAPGSADR